jgi:hypothetical protein
MERSKAEIERLVRRFGATGFMSGWYGTEAMVQFQITGRHVKILLPIPDPAEERFHTTPTGRRRKGNAVSEAYEQEIRRAWRAMALVIKAKLEAVESGITTFETEFLAHLVMPDGRTVADHAMPAVLQAMESGKVPRRPLLPEFTT